MSNVLIVVKCMIFEKERFFKKLKKRGLVPSACPRLFGLYKCGSCDITLKIAYSLQFGGVLDKYNSYAEQNNYVPTHNLKLCEGCFALYQIAIGKKTDKILSFDSPGAPFSLIDNITEKDIVTLNRMTKNK